MRGWIATLTALTLMSAAGAAAQRPEPAAITGVVLDADASTPVAGATVALVPAADAAVPVVADDERPFAAANRATKTGPEGRYRFSGLAPGAYVLRVESIGYRPATVRVELRGPGDARVSVGLDVEPIRLDPVDVTGAAEDLLHARLDGDAALELGRLPAVRLRQSRHLPTDVRVLTHDELVEAITLGEIDIFRALQRLPGVTGYDDVSAELWTRGAGRGETVTLFDGLPLYEPLHGTGELTVVSPEGIGMAFLHPGVRPADLTAASAAVVDLRTRPGAGDDDGGIRGAADVSVSSARLAVDGRAADGGIRWLIAGRRSYLDLFLDDIYQYVPASRFWDLTGRVDADLGDGRGLELSGLWQSNRYDPEEQAFIADWDGGHRGTLAARATLRAPLFGHRASQTVGYSRHGTEIGARIPAGRLGPDPGVALPARDATLDHLAVKGELEPGDGADTWRAGYDVVRETVAYDGAEPQPLVPYLLEEEPDRLAYDQASTRLGVWAQHRWRPAERLTLEAGARLETGATANAGSLRVAPNLMGRFGLTEHASLFAGASRSYQYAQPLAPTGIPGVLEPRSIWLLANDSVPALRSDVATAGAEVWLGGSWLAAINGYARRTAGLTLPDPAPGPAGTGAMWVAGEREAYGIEASLRRVAGRATVSMAYSYGHATTEADGRRFTSATDRPHSVDATGLVRLGRGFRVGAAYGYASGIPFTRAARTTLEDGTDAWVLGQPHALRTDPYSRLDLFVDWTHRFDGWGLGVYMQFRNVLDHKNASWYLGTIPGECREHPASVASCREAGDGLIDRFSGAGVGVNLGVRVTF